MAALEDAPRSGTVVVRGGRIVMASEGAATLLGRGLRELQGREFADLFVPEDRERIVDRYQRRLRGEPVPSDYEAAVLRADGARLTLDLHVDLEGRDVVVHYRDISEEMERRSRLLELATLGAAIQRERTEADVLGRLRSDLPALGIAPILMRPGADGVLVEWSRLPGELEEVFVGLSGRSLDGFTGRWSPYSRRIWEDGAAFSDDWGTEASEYAPELLAPRAQELAAAFRLQRAVGVRIDERAGARFYLVLPCAWFRREDLAAVRLFGAQVAAALDAASAIADLSHRLSDLTAVHAMTARIFASAPGDVRGLLRDGARAAAAALGCQGGAAFLVEEDGAALEGVGLVGSARGTSRARVPITADALAMEAVRTGGVAWSPDVRREPRSALFGRRLPLPAMLAAPVVSRSSVRAVLFVAARAGRVYTDADRALAMALAGELAVGLENARLYAEARERLSELTTVIDVARVVSSTLDQQEVLTAGAEHLKETLRATACTILLEDLQRQELRRAVHRGAPLGPEALPLDAGPAGDALRARAPATGQLQGRQVLVVPLHVRDQPVGVAVVGAEGAARGFSPGELSRAMAIASQLAVAVDNARLYQETRRRAEELGLLHEVGRSLVSLDIEEVLRAGVRNLARIVDAPTALLALARPDGTLEFRAAWGGPPGVVGTRPRLDPVHLLGASGFARREPLIVEDVLTDPRIPEEQRRAVHARAILGLPLLVRERLVGAAVIVEGRGPRRFSTAEVDRATAVANQLAVAVENARLYEDLRRSYEQLGQAQRQLIEQERLAALGELSAVVAHEVRNPLGVIFNSLGSLRRMLQPQGDARVLLDIVGEEADRLNRIVRDLLDFARPVTPVLRPEPLQGVVEEAVSAALAESAAPVEVAWEPGSDLPPVPMDGHLVRQAVLNVAANAIQAMPRGGRLTVRTRRDPAGVLVELEDSGPGIPDEIRGRIFEPFFTTKASGTGLGLAVVKRIMDGHRGEISVFTRPAGGAVVQLRFPVALRAPGRVETGDRMG